VDAILTLWERKLKALSSGGTSSDKTHLGIESLLESSTESHREGGEGRSGCGFNLKGERSRMIVDMMQKIPRVPLCDVELLHPLSQNQSRSR